ncbi:hypothetical protein [Bradyrhizobium sp. CCBAU 11361]|uniref:hypothetical protein n=1 Tax=Bradyrhizobium sp. CCBAU 11361 TaxID=1630812 RepID=UPI002303852C|nr:hypothetical protein [Bradyrhizobium sp. CCBAU 11361]MDA9487943.1 hypothetical protein [Bradyrhizobium sp. CCBAU 11361]
MPAHGKYKSAAAVAAIGMPKDTFNRWLDRKVISLSPDDIPGDGRGKPRRFGPRTLVKLAIAHKVALLGLPANMAVALAEKFTDVPQYGRPLGQLFPVGTTWIVHSPARKASVVNVKPEEDASALLDDATLAINVNQIVSTINFEIGIIK